MSPDKMQVARFLLFFVQNLHLKFKPTFIPTKLDQLLFLNASQMRPAPIIVDVIAKRGPPDHQNAETT